MMTYSAPSLMPRLVVYWTLIIFRPKVGLALLLRDLNVILRRMLMNAVIIFLPLHYMTIG
jgi:hypothetical protein